MHSISGVLVVRSLQGARISAVRQQCYYAAPLSSRSFTLGGALVRTNSSLANSGKPLTGLTIGVLREVFPGEKRVAQTPETVAQLTKKGCKVVLENDAGRGACFAWLEAQPYV